MIKRKVSPSQSSMCDFHIKASYFIDIGAYFYRTTCHRQAEDLSPPVFGCCIYSFISLFLFLNKTNQKKYLIVA